MRKIKFIAQKEVRHILRDPRSLIIAMLMPLMMTFLYGYAINLDIKNIKLAVLDYDDTVESRELTSQFYNSGYFHHPGKQATIFDPEKLFRAGGANSILIIKPGFSRALVDLSPFQLGLMVDGSDANTASAATNYSNVIVSSFLKERLPEGLEIPGVVIAPRVYYNSDLKSSTFFVPGLIAVILMMISALLTSITIAREKESGTIEQLLTAPVTPRQIIIGKVVPYIFLAVTDGILVIIFAIAVFGVPFKGSAPLLLLIGLIYISAALSLGILISTLVSTQLQAMMAAQIATVLPSIMLSGYIFEIRNMPKFLQYVTYIIPARYFIPILRGIMLKGSSISFLWHEAIFLVGLTVILLFVATKKFKLKIG